MADTLDKVLSKKQKFAKFEVFNSHLAVMRQTVTQITVQLAVMRFRYRKHHSGYFLLRMSAIRGGTEVC